MREKSRLDHEGKIFCSENRKYIEKLAQKNFDTFVGPILTLDLTNMCNYKCKHCIDYRMVWKENGRELDFELLCSLIKELYENGCKNIELTGGGEPTLYSRFQEFCRYAFNMGYHLALITNGSKLGKLINFFGEVHFDWIRVSIDATDSSLYEEIHGVSGEILDDILDSVSRIARKTTVGLSYILRRQNGEDAYNALVLAQRLQVSYLEIKPLKNKNNGKMEMSVEEYVNLITRLEKKAQIMGIELVYPLPQHKEYNFKENEFVCWSSYLRTVLTPSGMYRCSYLRGSVDKGPVPHNVEEFIEYRNRLNSCDKICYNTGCSRIELNKSIQRYITQLENGLGSKNEQETVVKDGRWL